MIGISVCLELADATINIVIIHGHIKPLSDCDFGVKQFVVCLVLIAVSPVQV